MRELIFVDTETGGLNADNDPIVELTYAPLVGSPKTLYFGVKEVDPFIDEFIGFTKRGLAGKRSTVKEIAEFLDVSRDATMVAANPSFDKEFLVNNDLWNFHYRMLDIESYAAKALDLDEVPGMKTIHNILTEQGYFLPPPDHTSRGDVITMRYAYEILRKM